VKKLEFAPSPYPLPAGERVNPVKLKINFLPLDGEGQGGGDFGNFFTASGRARVGGDHEFRCARSFSIIRFAIIWKCTRVAKAAIQIPAINFWLLREEELWRNPDRKAAKFEKIGSS
jgi:hypothetical protein